MRWDERAASWKTGTPLTSGRDGAPGHMTVDTARSGLLHRASRGLTWRRASPLGNHRRRSRGPRARFRQRTQAAPSLMEGHFEQLARASVRTVTHIAPPDANGKTIGEEVIQEGVIGIPPPNQLGLCAGVTNASYATTTEVYPDSPSATPEQCNAAQVTAVCAALDHLIAHEPLCK